MDAKELKNRVYRFSVSVVKFVNKIDSKRINISLMDQTIRSATSIGANLIEARAAHSKKDFIKFYEIALKSSNETKYWFCLLRDALNINDGIEELLNEANEISKILAVSVITMKSNSKFIKEPSEDYNSNLSFEV
jgi:four helix bundle protein